MRFLTFTKKHNGHQDDPTQARSSSVLVRLAGCSYVDLPGFHPGPSICLLKTGFEVIIVSRNLPKRVRKIGDYICETLSKVGVKMWFQIFSARVGTSRTEKSVCLNLGPKTRILTIFRGEIDLFRRSHQKSETIILHRLSMLFHKSVFHVVV